MFNFWESKKTQQKHRFICWNWNGLVVKPTHLKKMLVKLEIIFPKFRSENKHIYLKPPPSLSNIRLKIAKAILKLSGCPHVEFWIHPTQKFNQLAPEKW